MNGPDNTQPAPRPPAPSPVVGLLPVIFTGLALVIGATLLLRWPSDVPGEPYARLVPHWTRLLAGSGGLAPPDWIWRRVWDGLHYGLLLAGLVLAVSATMTRRAYPWIGLLAVGLLGVVYTGGMALYPGPLFATPGYLLILFIAGLVLFAWPRKGKGEPS